MANGLYLTLTQTALRHCSQLSLPSSLVCGTHSSITSKENRSLRSFTFIPTSFFRDYISNITHTITSSLRYGIVIAEK